MIYLNESAGPQHHGYLLQIKTERRGQGLAAVPQRRCNIVKQDQHWLYDSVKGDRQQRFEEVIGQQLHNADGQGSDEAVHQEAQQLQHKVGEEVGCDMHKAEYLSPKARCGRA